MLELRYNGNNWNTAGLCDLILTDLIFIAMAGQRYVFEDLTVGDAGITTAARIRSARIASEMLAAMALVLRLAMIASNCLARPHNSACRE